MKQTRSKLIPIAMLWTLVMLGVAIVMAVEAALSLERAQQACFVNYPATPCPGGDDPAVVRLTVAFFVVPFVWLIGLGVVGLKWVRTRRRDQAVGGR
jgi:hypothetical protein